MMLPLAVMPRAEQRFISLDLIRTDGGTQPRAELNDALIDEYAEAMRNGVTFPPVTVYYDGEHYWLSDGFHRLQAAARCGRLTICAEINQGALSDAQWHSYSVNQAHGLRRTNDDKRRAVEAALRHPYANRFSNVQIARHVGVDERSVRNYRGRLEATSELPKSNLRTGLDGRTINTANIGRTAPAPKSPALPEPPEVSAPAAQDAVHLPVPELYRNLHDAPAALSVVPAAGALISAGTSALPAEPPAASACGDTHAPTHPGPQPADPLALVGPAAVRNVGHLVKIIQGDARCAYDVAGVHLVVTSPPYNVGVAYGAHDDALTDDAYRALLLDVFANCRRTLVEGGRIAVVVPFGVGRNPWQPLAGRVADWLTRAGFTLRGQIVWDKASTGNRTTWGSFRQSSDPALRDTTEAIIVAHKGASRLELPANVVLHDAKGPHTAWLADADDFMTLAQDHWQIAPESAQRIGHPAPFPVALAERLIRFYAYPGCHVLDPFAGSGTVGVAAQRLGCRATLIDVDPAYCALAARRCMEERSHG